MRNHYRVLAVMLCAALLCAALTACKPPNRELSEEEKERIQARFAAYLDDRGISAAAYAVYHGEVLFDGGAGTAAADKANSSDVVYGVASLTKQFTAAAVMQLYEAGKLDINDKLSVYFPDYRYADKITVKQLLYQRSGIPDYSVKSAGKTVTVYCYGDSGAGVNITADNTAEENIQIIRDYFLSRELLFEPETRFDYSDSNFALLAEIIAQVSGMDYHDYVRQYIFEPLGMETAAFIDDYDYDDGVTVAATDRSEFSMNYYDFKGAEYGCGDLLASPKDLYRWYRGFTSGKVVGDSAYNLMTKNYSKPDELGYGFGLMISDEGESKTVYHYGYIPSYYSAVCYVPEYDYFEAVLSNHADGGPQKAAADMAAYFGSVIDLELGGID